MDKLYEEREKKIKEEHKKKLKKEEYVNECIRKVEEEQMQKQVLFLEKEKKREQYIKSVNDTRYNNSLNKTKRIEEKFSITVQNRNKLDELETQKINEMEKKKIQKEEEFNKKKKEEEK